MRKMIFTLLLLLVPVLANAWTLTIKVAGVASAQPATPVTVAYTTSAGAATTANLKIGTNYLYPAGAITVVAPAGPAGAPTVSGSATTMDALNAFTTGPKTVTLTYATPSVAYNSVTVAQATGGTIYAKALNNTWSTSSVSGYLQGALVPVTITADGNYKITGYTDGATPTTGLNTKQISFTVAANGQTVTPVFAVDAKTTASLFAPTNAVAGKSVTVSVVATTNDAPLTYSFKIGAAAATAFTSASSYTFTAVEGTTVVKAQVKANSGVVVDAPDASIVVANALATTNSGCVSCHSTQPAVHTYTTLVTACTGCHSAAPHTLGLANIQIPVQADCVNCHANRNTSFVTSVHFSANGQNTANSCAFCHGFDGLNATTLHGKAPSCDKCHAEGTTEAFEVVQPSAVCKDCHAGGGHPHSIKTTAAAALKTKCIECHAAVINHPGDFVKDNNGVRAITTEFAKWSHHVTGVTLDDAHCAACHLEGKVEAGNVVVDPTKHMANAKTHLRNADTDTDLEWDPSAPNHSNMDNFCMSCHDANGATSTTNLAIQAVINTKGLNAAGKTASPSNPFGDTISNRYDKMQRPAVVDASSQFNTTNNSHHAVKGARYTKRTRIANANDPRAMTAAQSLAFAANSSATLKGKRSTMFDAGVLNQLYVPLENAAGEVAPRTGSDTLGDDSTLHCGDCHTVGQWKAGSSVDRLGNPTTVAIGAHGSNNEYLLRNSIGTDERHTQNAYTLVGGIVTFTNPNGAFLVCYNCHAYAAYGSVFNATGVGQTGGLTGPHAGEYDQAGRCDGVGNTLPFGGYTTGTATDGTQFASRFEGPISKYSTAASYAGEQNPDFGNIFGIQCLNCHNSGLGNGFGGIHGSANNTHTTTATTNPLVTGGAYIDGMGNTTKVERFLPGLGNAMHVPGTLGGFTGGTTTGSPAYTTGGISNDTNWEQKHWQQTASTTFGPTGTGPVAGTLTSAGAGCYTLSESATAATATVEGPSVTGAGGPATEGIGIWGGCDDHGAAQGKGDHGFIKRIVRPVTY